MTLQDLLKFQISNESLGLNKLKGFLSQLIQIHNTAAYTFYNTKFNIALENIRHLQSTTKYLQQAKEIQ